MIKLTGIRPMEFEPTQKMKEHWPKINGKTKIMALDSDKAVDLIRFPKTFWPVEISAQECFYQEDIDTLYILVKGWCECDWPKGMLRTEKIFCEQCGQAIECDLCDEEDETMNKQAQIFNMDYMVCREHDELLPGLFMTGN